MAAKKPIAWIGLGRIGLPMAARLAAAGWPVRGFDVSAERRVLAAGKGITPSKSVEDAVSAAELVFTSLPTEKIAEQVATSLKLPEDAVLVETSTIGPEVSARIGQARSYVRSPISGSTTMAEAGTLTAFASGPKALFERAQPAIAGYSRAQLWLGEGEEARYAKLAANLMVAVTAGMMGEALALGRKGGIAWPQLLDLLGESAVGSPLVKYKIDPLKRRDFTAAATNSLVAKDLDVIVAAAQAAGVPVPLAEHMQALYRQVIDEGLAEEDFFGVIKVTEKLSGL